MNASPTLRVTCPKCAVSVRVRSKLAGRAVRCPRCREAFRVPGSGGSAAENESAAASANMAIADEDDDWLRLDEPLTSEETTPSAAASPPASAPAPASVADSPPPSSQLEDLFGTSEELPPLGPPSENPAPPIGVDDWLGLDDLPDPAAPPPSPVADSTPAAEQKPAAGSPSSDAPPAAAPPSEYRVRCPVCESSFFIRPERAGRMIRCGDCFSDFVAPPPPVAKPKAKTIDLEKAETFTLHGSDDSYRTETPLFKSAAQLLREAEDAEEEDDDPHRPPLADDNPDVFAWLKNLFGIFGSPAVMIHWLAISVIAGVSGGLVASFLDPRAAGILLLVGLPFLLATIIIWGVTILVAAAEGKHRLTEWPYSPPGEWIGNLVTVGFVFILSSAPGAVLGHLLVPDSLAMAGMTMFSVFLLFPFLLLSVIDSESVWMPYSAEVTASVSRCYEDWGGMYFSSGLLFAGTFLLLVVATFLPPLLWIPLTATALVGCGFTYFNLIGRLAYAIGQRVDLVGEESEEEEASTGGV